MSGPASTASTAGPTSPSALSSLAVAAMALSPPAPAVKTAPGSSGPGAGTSLPQDGSTQTPTPAGAAANLPAQLANLPSSSSLMSLSPGSRSLLGGTSDPSTSSGPLTDPVSAMSALNAMTPAASSALAPPASLAGTLPSDLPLPTVQVADQVVGAVASSDAAGCVGHRRGLAAGEHSRAGSPGDDGVSIGPGPSGRPRRSASRSPPEARSAARRALATSRAGWPGGSGHRSPAGWPRGGMA